MIAIVDYGLGNIANLVNAMTYLGYEVVVTREEAVMQAADIIILPGVGHFKDAMQQIETNNLRPILDKLKDEKPFIGICLGMQLLFEFSEEGHVAGLGYLPGQVKRIQGDNLVVPHLGWNNLIAADPALDGEDVYFIHSYQVVTDQNVVATCNYGPTPITAIVQKDNLIGIQFHPEKSGKIGLQILAQALKGGFNRD